VFLAPHPGPGQLVMSCIDPSVADEADPLSVRPELDPFDPANGFVPAPHSSRYPAGGLLTAYRAAQRDRVARIDAVARERAAEVAAVRARGKAGGDPRDRPAALALRLLTVYRTDADPRPSTSPWTERAALRLPVRPPARPDQLRAGRVRPADHSGRVAVHLVRAELAGRFRALRPGVSAPTLFLELTGDQAAFPADSRAMREALGAADLTSDAVRGTHFGGPIGPGEPPGSRLAGVAIAAWLRDRFPLAPPAG
jgi:hypothetical protein